MAMDISNVVLSNNTNKSRSIKYKPINLIFSNDENVFEEVIQIDLIFKKI